MEALRTMAIGDFELLTNPVDPLYRHPLEALAAAEGQAVLVKTIEGDDARALGALKPPLKPPLKRAAKRLHMAEPRFATRVVQVGEAPFCELWMAPGAGSPPAPPLHPQSASAGGRLPTSAGTFKVGDACNHEGCTGRLKSIQGGALRCGECGMRPVAKAS